MLKSFASLLRAKFLGEDGVAISYTSSKGITTAYKIAPDSNLLDELLKQSVELSYSCKTGLCQSCKLQCSNADALPEASQKGLSESEKKLGYFLPCVCNPTKNLKLQATDTAKPVVEATVLAIDKLSQDIIRLKLNAPFEFRAGQFCNLYRDKTTFRSYSIASTSNDNYLEFHIRLIDAGAFSMWAAEKLKPGDKLDIQGPYGKCIFIEPDANTPSQPILLSGTGTGLAPLIGVIKDALKSGKTKKLHLILGARDSNQFYLEDELIALASENEPLTVSWLSGTEPEPTKSHISKGDIYEFVKNSYPDLSNFTVYLCGAESFVHKMKKTCYLNDASLSKILSDPFVPSAQAKNTQKT